MKSFGKKSVREHFNHEDVAKHWTDFQKSGLLWFINRILHIFGWAISIKWDDKGKFICAEPVRVTFRGFTGEVEDWGYAHVAEYMAKNAKKLQKEAKLDYKD